MGNVNLMTFRGVAIGRILLSLFNVIPGSTVLRQVSARLIDPAALRKRAGAPQMRPAFTGGPWAQPVRAAASIDLLPVMKDSRISCGLEPDINSNSDSIGR